jgi:hypothetical protein
MPYPFLYDPKKPNCEPQTNEIREIMTSYDRHSSVVSNESVNRQVERTIRSGLFEITFQKMIENFVDEVASEYVSTEKLSTEH